VLVFPTLLYTRMGFCSSRLAAENETSAQLPLVSIFSGLLNVFFSATSDTVTGHIPHVVGGHRVTLTYNLCLDDDGRAYGKDMARKVALPNPLQGGNEYAFKLSGSSLEI